MVNTSGVDERRFNREYKELFPIIFRVALRVTGDCDAAEDLCHDAFIKYYQRHEPLPDTDQAKYWLIRVVKNMSLNYAKRKTRERKAIGKLQKIEPVFADSEEKRVLENETKKEVQDALDKLPYKLRAVLVFKEYGGLNYRDIGKLMGISEGNVKVRVFRAREQLGKILSRRRQNHVSEG
ncbi:MAG: RNA polymerase sigma factor [Spirochaetales bacterium]|nr:RNA polymerase sigma factor [Spirochaetales bacterium]